MAYNRKGARRGREGEGGENNAIRGARESEGLRLG